MLRHIVLIGFRPEATKQDRELVRAAIEALPASVPEIKSLRCGFNVGKVPDQLDFGSVIDFENMESFRVYLSSPAHHAYVHGPGKAFVAKVISVQHEW